MKYIPTRTFSLHELAFYFMKNDKILYIARNIVLFLGKNPKLCKGLVWQNSRKIRQKVSLTLVLSHSRSIRAIFLQIFSIKNLCGNRNLYFLFNLRAHVGNFIDNTVSMVRFPSYSPL